MCYTLWKRLKNILMNYNGTTFNYFCKPFLHLSRPHFNSAPFSILPLFKIYYWFHVCKMTNADHKVILWNGMRVKNVRWCQVIPMIRIMRNHNLSACLPKLLNPQQKRLEAAIILLDAITSIELSLITCTIIFNWQFKTKIKQQTFSILFASSFYL